MFPQIRKSFLFYAAVGVIVLLFINGCSKDAQLVGITDNEKQFKILVFSKTEGFRHASIAKGLQLFDTLGSQNDFSVDQTEEAADFTTENLSKYQAVVFLNTSGDVLDDSQQSIFENYIQAGGSFMGVHAAADTESEWLWYGELVGALFESHPEIASAEIDVINNNHLSTKNVPNDWSRSDEWYNFKEVSGNISILLNLDESTYSGGTMGENHPIAWYHEFDGGRSFYTGGGHTEASYDEPDFQEHLLGGILYCLGQ